ncbi:unnamed protein product, partial [marine sediment metagenome]
IINAGMRWKQYHMVCAVCGKSYIATRKGSHYCSDRCRAHASNVRKTKDGTKSKTVYIPTGRSVGRPRKDPAPAPIPVRKDDLKNYKEFKTLVEKSMDPPPSILVLESTRLRHEIDFKKLVKKSMEASLIEDRELATREVGIAEQLIKDRDNAKTFGDWYNAKWRLDDLFYGG